MNIYIYTLPKVVHVCMVHAHVCMIMKENLFLKKSFQTTNIANVCQQFPANRLGFFPVIYYQACSCQSLRRVDDQLV